MADIPFSEELKQRTKQQHGEAEESPFVEELLSGKRTKDDYLRLAQQQYFIYRELEEVAAELKSDPDVAQFVAPELERVSAIESDLEFLTGPNWQQHLTPLPATNAYTARIHQTLGAPHRFIAHQYTRYLGDLSGGQVVHTWLRRQFGFDRSGVAFYNFEQIPNPKRFKDEYRTKLDDVAWTDEQRQEVVDEVREVFRLNTALFQELAATANR